MTGPTLTRIYFLPHFCIYPAFVFRGLTGWQQCQVGWLGVHEQDTIEAMGHQRSGSETCQLF